MMDARIRRYLEGCHAIGYAPTFFFDMDGVLADFVGGVCRLYERDPAYLLCHWPRGVYSMNKIQGMEDCVERIKEAGPEFWANLNPLDKGCEALTYVAPYAKIVIATDPTSFDYAPQGKRIWLRKWFGNIEDVVFTGAKRLLAQPGRFLVDDHYQNCLEWESSGGSAILWPQPWNQS